MKWEPIAAMILVIALGIWIVWSQGAFAGPELRAGAQTFQLRLPNARGVVEVAPDERGDPTFRIVYRDGSAGQIISESEFRRTFGDATTDRMTVRGGNPLFRLLNITSWASMVWIAVGLGGQVVFSGRMLLQWYISEKKRQSVIPEAFWWMSMFGGLALFSYFAWRQDIVGVLGQSSGIVIYARNLRLIHKQKRREARRAAADAGAAPADRGDSAQDVPMSDSSSSSGD